MERSADIDLRTNSTHSTTNVSDIVLNSPITQVSRDFLFSSFREHAAFPPRVLVTRAHTHTHTHYKIEKNTKLTAGMSRSLAIHEITITIVPTPREYVQQNQNHAAFRFSFLFSTRTGRRTKLHTRKNTKYWPNQTREKSPVVQWLQNVSVLLVRLSRDTSGHRG